MDYRKSNCTPHSCMKGVSMTGLFPSYNEVSKNEEVHERERESKKKRQKGETIEWW